MMISVADLFALALLVVALTLSVVFAVLARGKFRPTLRPLSAYEALSGQVGEAVESGGRVHVSTGPGSIVGEDTTATLAGLVVLEAVAERSAISDRPPLGTTGDATALLAVSDAIRRAYRRQGALARLDPTASRLVAIDPLTFAAGATSLIVDEDTTANVLIGSFGQEVALMTEAGAREGLSQSVGSARIEGQAVAFVAADHPLIGEEMFVAGAYLGKGPAWLGSLAAQDVLRWLLVAAIGLGVVLKTINVLR
jgi:hypothetical protein